MAQHVFDRAEPALALAGHPRQLARGREALDPVRQRLDLARDGRRPLFGEGFDALLQRVDALFEMMAGPLGRDVVELVGQVLDLGRERGERPGLDVAAAAGQNGAANVLDRGGEMAELAHVGLGVAQAADLEADRGDLLGEVVEFVVLSAGGDDLAQFGDVAQYRREIGRLAAARRERIDLGGQMRDLVMEALIAVAGTVLRKP